MPRLFILLLIVFAIALLGACYPNPQPPGLTPIPTLAPGAQPTVISSLPGAPPPSVSGTPAATPGTVTGPTTPTASAGATSAASPGATETETGYEPPNCGGTNCEQPGPAVTQNLQGNADAGTQVFTTSCQTCHGAQGKGGVANPGSEDGTVPSLNPFDPMFNKNDAAELKRELDLFIEHGSKTDGALSMPAWGDTKQLTPQQIADVIAYIMNLNGVH